MRSPRERPARAKRSLVLQLLGVLLVASATSLAVLRARSPQGLLVHVADDQLGVLADYRNDEVRPVPSPGYRFVLPQVQEMYGLRRSPLEYVMEGNERPGDLHVPRLVVRASEGSSFWFERVSIQYALDPSRAVRALTDTGPSDELRARLVDAFARSILRDEFGRFSPTEIVLPENRRAAAERSRERLGDALAPHGLVVLEVALTKPAFDARYEQTIERRKIGEQEIARLEREAELLLAGREDVARNLRAQQQLVLAKTSASWEAAVEAQARAAEALRAGRQVRLDRARREQDLALERARQEWDQALAAAVEEGARLEAGREERLEAVRRERAFALETSRAEWSRREDALRRETERIVAGREDRLALVRGRTDLELEQARDRWELARTTRERDARSRLAEARATSAARVAAAELERDASIASADALEQAYERENRRFIALASALERGGPALVRAALVEVLSGVPIDVAPLERPLEASAVAARRFPDDEGR